jgi:hypothetical protein
MKPSSDWRTTVDERRTPVTDNYPLGMHDGARGRKGMQCLATSRQTNRSATSARITHIHLQGKGTFTLHETAPQNGSAATQTRTHADTHTRTHKTTDTYSTTAAARHHRQHQQRHENNTTNATTPTHRPPVQAPTPARFGTNHQCYPPPLHACNFQHNLPHS